MPGGFRTISEDPPLHPKKEKYSRGISPACRSVAAGHVSDGGHNRCAPFGHFVAYGLRGGVTWVTAPGLPGWRLAPSGGWRARKVGQEGQPAGCGRTNASLRLTPARRQDRLERLRTCGRRPQGVKTVSSARALVADARKASRPSRPRACLWTMPARCRRPS
jgi:hypothetical protein